MPAPQVFKAVKGGLQLVSYIDRTQWDINQLSRAALHVIGKDVRKQMIIQSRKLPGMKRSKRPLYAIKYRVPMWKNGDFPAAVIGIRHGTWYGENQEFGTRSMKKKGILRDTTYNMIAEIRYVMAIYLQAIEDEVKKNGFIHEGEMESAGEEE